MKLIKTLTVVALFLSTMSETFGLLVGTVNRGYSQGIYWGAGSGYGRDANEPYPCDVVGTNSFWFSYVPVADGTLTITTTNSDFDTAIEIYTGPGTSYATIYPFGVCNDDMGGGITRSEVVFIVEQGSNYWVQIGDKGNSWHQLSVDYDLIPTLITGSTGQIVSAMAAMTITNIAEPKPCSISCKYTRWVRFDITASGTLTLDTVGSSFDTVLDVYSGAAGFGYPAGGTSLTCNDDATGTKSRVTLSVTPGQFIWAQVGGKGTVRGTIKLNYYLAP